MPGKRLGNIVNIILGVLGIVFPVAAAIVGDIILDQQSITGTQHGLVDICETHPGDGVLGRIQASGKSCCRDIG